jgi:hypothetical protein
VRYGTHASVIEAKSKLYVVERTSIPVPKFFAAYAYGPLDQDVDGFGSVYDTCIFRESMEGEDLGKSWENCTSTEKQMISTDLKKYIAELHSLPEAGHIVFVYEGPITDILLT